MYKVPFLASFEQAGAPNGVHAQKCWERLLQMGLPSRQHEDFHYMKLGALESMQYVAVDPALDVPEGSDRYQIVFSNGHFCAEKSRVPAGCQLLPLSQAAKSYSVLFNNRYNSFLLEDRDPFALLNGAYSQPGAFLYVPPKVVCKEPIYIVSVLDTKQPHATIMPRLHCFAGKFSEVAFVASTKYVEAESSFYNALFDFELEEEAKVALAHRDFAQGINHSVRFDAFRATLKRNSRFQAVQLTDSENTRRDYKVVLAGEAAEADLSGLWFLDGQKETHTNVTIVHKEPHTRSLQLFKGVLDGESQASFQGKILVEQKAQKTESYQLNNNLILSDKAQANSKPNLEIFADDVKASHGATVGQLDAEQLFYLKTRGIAPAVSKGLLIRGFCEEVIQKVPTESMRTLAEELLALRYNITV